MEQKDMKKQYWSELLTGALVLGLLYAVQLVLSYVFKDGGPKVISWLLSVYGFAAIAWALFHYGKRASKLELYRTKGFSYGAAFGFSMLILIISGVLVGVAQWILQNVIDPEYYAQMYRRSMELIIQTTPSLSDKQIEAMKTGQEITRSIWGMIGASMMTMILLGGLIALITSAVIKRPANPFAEDRDTTPQQPDTTDTL